jgi:hypothetical protein
MVSRVASIVVFGAESKTYSAKIAEPCGGWCKVWSPSVPEGTSSSTSDSSPMGIFDDALRHGNKNWKARVGQWESQVLILVFGCPSGG